MAVGNTQAANQSLTHGSTMTIQPGGSTEWIIHNIFYAGQCTIAVTDGSNQVIFKTVTSTDPPGGLMNLRIEITNAWYIVITNTSSSATYVYGYSGRQII